MTPREELAALRRMAELEAKAAGQLPSKVQWDTSAEVLSEVPGPRQTSLTQQFGRAAASLADVTIGNVLPAIAQQVAYPFARIGKTPEQAQAEMQRVQNVFGQPFGKAFGVADTPEYQQEASRQLFDFIGQNIQKGTSWIAKKTGIPQSDVENIAGSLSLGAPKLATPLRRVATDVVEQAIENVKIGAKLPFEPLAQSKRERLSKEDYARGPQIDAAREAQRLGIALNPTDISPKSIKAKISSNLAGVRGVETIENVNVPKVTEIARRDMGLSENTPLNKSKTFNDARESVAEPYRKIEQIPLIAGDDATRQALEALRPKETLIGGESATKAINKLVDSALEKVDAGMSGEAYLNNIRQLRSDAKRIYNNPNAKPKDVSKADANLAIANTLEGMIENNIFDPRLISDFRAARQKMARIYAYEGATDLNTGMVDPIKIARITAKDNNLTGDIASLGQIAGNFPSAFKMTGETPWHQTRLSRSGLGGATGAVIGSNFGLTGSIVGGALGGLVGDVGSGWMAKRIASPAYQQGLNIRDARLPMNQMATTTAQQNTQNALVPYQTPVEVLNADQGPYRPNFIFGQPEQSVPQVTPIRPDLSRALPAPSAESTLNALRTEDARRAAMSRALGQEAEAKVAAAEAATRRPATREVILDFDPITGRYREASQGLKGATPETFSNFGAALESASSKVALGQRFNLTAAEKVAWEKTKIDLAEVAPGFKALSDKAVAEKMMDRAWVEETAIKARQKAVAFQELASRAANERARQSALQKREQLMDLAEQMEESLRNSRPDTSRKGQGPKTREFQRNMLKSNNENQNALAR